MMDDAMLKGHQYTVSKDGDGYVHNDDCTHPDHWRLMTLERRAEYPNMRRVVQLLYEAMLLVRPHIGDEMQRSWPDDAEFDAAISQFEQALVVAEVVLGDES